MCYFYRVINLVVAFADIINHIYDEAQLSKVSIVNLNTFANQLYIKKIITNYT